MMDLKGKMDLKKKKEKEGKKIEDLEGKIEDL